MATPPAQAAQPTQPTPQDDESAEQPVTVCISIDPSGKLTVGLQGEDMQPVASLKEAMEKVAQLLDGDDMQSEQDGNAAMGEGYGSE